MDDKFRFENEAARLFLPLATRYPLALTSGSGIYDVEISPTSAEDGGLSFVDGVFLAGDAPGTFDVVISDRVLTGIKTRMTVAVVASQAYDAYPSGDFSVNYKVVTGVDLNGDGYNDVVLGHADGGFGRVRGGGVLIYEGSPDGLKPDPVQTIAGKERFAEFGFDLEVADLDQDGLLDLVVSARLADTPPNDGGAVYVYKGLDDGFFDETPAGVLTGAFGGDQMGYSLAVCDFNGDGLQDLALGAVGGDERGGVVFTNNQGAVYIYLNSASGFGSAYDDVVYGKLPSEGGPYVGVQDLRFGAEVGAGDVDGDGLCDLVAASEFARLYGQPNQGVVAVYRGRTAQGDDRVGSNRRPRCWQVLVKRTPEAAAWAGAWMLEISTRTARRTSCLGPMSATRLREPATTRGRFFFCGGREPPDTPPATVEDLWGSTRWKPWP